MIKVIYFDIGGVVFHDFYSRKGKEFIQTLRLPKEVIFKYWVETDHTDYANNKLSDEKRWKIFTDALGLPKEKITACIDALYKQYKPIYKIVNLIKKIKRERNVKLGVLADQPIGVVKFLKEKYPAIINLFDKYLVLFSAEVGLSKRDKDLKIFKEAIKRAKTPAKNILFVDNSMTNIQRAEKVGIQGFYFNIEEKTFNYLIKKLEQILN